MAKTTLDVTELLGDPDFVSPLVHVTQTSKVNGQGRNVLTQCQTPTVGSVYPATGRTISRLPESMRVANLSEFVIKGKIATAGPNGQYSDQIIFEGLTYQVQTVNDYSNWGQGFSQGTCIAQKAAS
jgi:hypothetical protein